MTDHQNAKSHTDHSKDHCEKKFIDLNDIFADIINTLIFNGGLSCTLANEDGPAL